jgi:hypothetical protein
MRLVGFLAAVLVLFSFLMPWFQADKWYGGEQVTMLQIVKGLYNNTNQIEETIMDVNDNPTTSTMFFLFYVAGVSLILIGALFGLTGGRGGHILGIIGMGLLTYTLWSTVGEDLLSVVSYGYIVGGIGFLIGLIGGGGGKK